MLSILSVLHTAEVELDQAQSTITYIPVGTPTRTPLGMAPKTRNFLRVC